MSGGLGGFRDRMTLLALLPSRTISWIIVSSGIASRALVKVSVPLSASALMARATDLSSSGNASKSVGSDKFISNVIGGEISISNLRLACSGFAPAKIASELTPISTDCSKSSVPL